MPNSVRVRRIVGVGAGRTTGSTFNVTRADGRNWTSSARSASTRRASGRSSSSSSGRRRLERVPGAPQWGQKPAAAERGATAAVRGGAAGGTGGGSVGPLAARAAVAERPEAGRQPAAWAPPPEPPPWRAWSRPRSEDPPAEQTSLSTAPVGTVGRLHGLRPSPPPVVLEPRAGREAAGGPRGRRLPEAGET